MTNIFVLTGAGISAESGLKTFRGSDGLWEGHRVEEVATPEAFAANPKLVQHFYNLRRAQLKEVKPNAAHFALAELEASCPEGHFMLCTQNVDDLHEQAGSQNVHHMHGELRKARCLSCGHISPWLEDIVHQNSECLKCKKPSLRPHIVWFGEIPFGMTEIQSFLDKTDIFIAIGTSGVVYPAASFVQLTPPHCQSYEVNLEASAISPYFDHHFFGPATEMLPKLVGELILQLL